MYIYLDDLKHINNAITKRHSDIQELRVYLATHDQHGPNASAFSWACDHVMHLKNLLHRDEMELEDLQSN